MRRSFTLPLVAAALATVGCVHLGATPECSAHGGDRWVEVKSAHFVVHSNLEPAVAVEGAEQLELTLAALHRAMRVSVPPPGAPIEAVLLRTTEQLQAAIETRHVVGQMRTDWRGPLVLIGGEARLTEDAPILHTLKHELVHYVAAHHLGPQPKWVAEGLARYFETLTLDPGKRLVRSGQLHDDAQDLVRSGNLTPLDTLWRWRSQLPPEAETAGYASSWAWVHFLFNRHRERLGAFLKGLQRREAPRAAFDAAFAGVDLTELADEAQHYVDVGSYRVTTVMLGEADTATTVGPYADSAVHATLARLAPKGSPHRAHELEVALQLNARERDAVRERVHAERDSSKKLELARTLATGPEATALDYRLLADALGRSAAARAERTRALEQALQLSPDDADALRALAHTVLSQRETARAVELAERAVKLAPYEPSGYVVLSDGLRAEGRCPEARAALERAAELMVHAPPAKARWLSRHAGKLEAACRGEAAPPASTLPDDDG
ncbi:MAG: DUF1570 domain-containing protein [Archangiaceae bacterium]|nr:DUF1570 domain-containing protein [Archangiaceae bacterium]